MKRVSWEIILAGLLLVAAAIYLLGKPSIKPASAPASVDQEKSSEANSEQVHIIDLKNIKELSNLDELRKLEEAENLEHLEKLKNLVHLIPSEARDEFLTEINEALRDLENENINVNIDLKDKLIVVDRNYQDLKAGEWGKTAPGVYTYLSEFDAHSLQKAIIELPFGSIKVVGSSDSQAKFTVQASGQVNSAEELESAVRLLADISDKEAAFSLKSLTSDQNIQLHATLNVPENIRLTSVTKAGHIEITNIEGQQVCETGGGHIRLERVRGDVTAKSSGGHITLTDGAGRFTLETMGGHVSAKNVEGDVTLSTYGGNIEAKLINGKVSASTKGGNVQIELNELDHKVTAETFGGNIVIAIPSSAGANINFKASNLVDVSGFTVDGKTTKISASGTINGGGPKISGSTKFGKVLLKAND